MARLGQNVSVHKNAKFTHEFRFAITKLMQADSAHCPHRNSVIYAHILQSKWLYRKTNQSNIRESRNGIVSSKFKFRTEYGIHVDWVELS